MNQSLRQSKPAQWLTRVAESHLHLYSHEVNRFLWIALIFFSIFFVTAIFRNYVDTAFLKRFGPKYIPWMLVINALLTFAVLGLVDRLARRFADRFLLAGFLLVYALSAGALYFMIKSSVTVFGYDIAYPILYQLLYLLDSILLVYLWNIAGDLFDTRQGKRIFPLITSSQVLGTTFGSFATEPIASAIGKDPTLIVFAAVCLACAVYLSQTGGGFLRSVETKRGRSQPKPTTQRITEVPALMAKYPIIRYLIITGLIPNVLLPIFFYQFSLIANNTFPTEQSLMAFLSVFRGVTTMSTFILLFFVGRMYSRIGLTNASLVHPINFTLLFGALTAFYNIYVACYGQFTVILIQRAVAGPVNKVLYNVIPSHLMAWSRSFIRGTVLKIGMLVGSSLMIILKPVLSAQQFAYIALALAVVWVVETLIFRKHYKRILKQVIVEKQVDFAEIESVRTFDSGGGAMELGPVSVEERSQESPAPTPGEEPSLEPDVALKLLDDPNPGTRAEAAATFSVQRDPRAVRKLVQLLNESDYDVRGAAVDALVFHAGTVLPFLEVCLIESPPRVKQGILEAIRLSGRTDFEIVPFLGKELSAAYGGLIVARQLSKMESCDSVEMLKDYLAATNDDILRLIFYALWVYHADMRLMYQALKSETASIAVELVENSIDRTIAPYLLPLIDDIPLDEKIEKGRKLLPLIRNDDAERLLTFLSESEDPLGRMLALFVIGDQLAGPSMVPIVESHLDDEYDYVRSLASYALARSRNEVPQMPDMIQRVDNLKQFTLFDGMGVRELHAIASVLNEEEFQPGELMIREGDENASIYLVVSGKVTVFENYGTSDQKEKITLGPTSFLGELSMFTRLPPSATCLAADPSLAYVLPHHQFQEIMRVYPQIGINLCRFFSLKLRQITY